MEVPINSSAPKPYIIHDAKKVDELPNKAFDVNLNIQFFDVVEFHNALRDMHFLYKQKGHQYESTLEQVFSNYSFVSKNMQEVFNTTWVKKLSEKRLLPQECRVKYIMPLVSIEGLLYITDERIYVQPKHA